MAIKLTFVFSFLLGCFGNTYATMGSILPPIKSSVQPVSSFGFEENKGQISGADASSVQFFMQQNDVSIFLRNDGISYQFTHFKGRKTTSHEYKRDMIEKVGTSVEQIDEVETYRMDITLLNCNTNPRILKQEQQADVIHYPSKDVLGVHRFDKITFFEMYPNIDWVVYTNNGRVKYDFVVHPGGNPSDIQLKTKWVEDLRLNADGSLTLTNRLGEITEESPVSFQQGKQVATQFKLNGGVVSFDLGAFDAKKTLVIDPSLIWGTYYGGTADELGFYTTVDLDGNVYMTGRTASLTAIADGGYQLSNGGGVYDAFLVKFNADGVRQWATYYGGTNSDIAFAVKTNSTGDVYIAGSTQSVGGIASGGHQNTLGGQSDAFLVKFDSDGNRIWGTYYGGTANDYGEGLAIAPDGTVYLAGSSASTANIAFSGHQMTHSGNGDAFLVKFLPDGTREWATYYGGSALDVGLACAVSNDGGIYLTGNSMSTNNISFDGHQMSNGGLTDAFLVKFNSLGIRQWATYYGGNDEEQGSECVIDSDGNVVLVGMTYSFNNIAFNGFQNTHGGGIQDSYMVKFDEQGQRIWASYFGGTGNDFCRGVCLDSDDNILITGQTSSVSGFALNACKSSIDGTIDAFLAKISPLGVLNWSTYYGGENNDRAYAVAYDHAGHVYFSGNTESPTGIASLGHQMSYGGGNDAFLVKYEVANPAASILSIQGISICEGEEIDVEASIAFGGLTPSFEWLVNGVALGVNSTTTTLSGLEDGDEITFEITSDASCETTVTAVSNLLVMTVDPWVTPQFNAVDNYCSGVMIPNLPNSSLNDIVGSWSPAIDNTETTTYTFTPDAGQCALETALEIVIDQPVMPNFDAQPAYCAESVIAPLDIVSNNGINGSWSPAIDNTETTTYTFTPDAGQCALETALEIVIHPLPDVELMQLGSELQATVGFLSYTWFYEGDEISGETSETIEAGLNGEYMVVVTDANNCEASDVIVYNSSGILEHTQMIQIFPNPASQVLTVQVSDVTPKSIQIRDNLGRIVLTLPMSNHAVSFDVSSLASGNYQLLLIHSEGVSRKPFQVLNVF